jgi:RNA polymerase sigma-70 factor (ECF subfamily)
MNEKEAIQLLKQRDPTGLEYLVSKHQIKAIRAAFLIVHDLSIAEDIVQSAYIRVYERIHQFDSERLFAPWFFRIVVNDAVKFISRRNQLVSLDNNFDETETHLLEILMDPTPGVESQVEEREQAQQIWSLLEKLSPDQRGVLVLRYYLECSNAEIAEYLEKPEGTVKWRLHAARNRLRALLKSGV